MRIKLLNNIRSQNIIQNATLIPKYIVLHCVGYQEEQILKGFSDTINEGGWGASPHYFIAQYPNDPLCAMEAVATKVFSEYPIYELVPIPQVAQHTGESRWHADNCLNQQAIGIELQVPNYAKALTGDGILDWFHFENFAQNQIQALKLLLKYLIKRYQITPQNVLGHSDIAAWRINPETGATILGKTDPGLTFPWELLAKEKIGVWPKSQRTRTEGLDTRIVHIQRLLSHVGYHISTDGILDLKTKHTIKAAQMHFLPRIKQEDPKFLEKLVIVLENLIDKQYAYNL